MKKRRHVAVNAAFVAMALAVSGCGANPNTAQQGNTAEVVEEDIREEDNINEDIYGPPPETDDASSQADEGSTGTSPLPINTNQNQLLYGPPPED